MTYGDLYNEFLDEMFNKFLDKIPPLKYIAASTLIRDNAPTDYRCGFVDWMDSLDLPKCSECGARDVSDDFKDTADSEVEVLCGVCAGTHFECEVCGEVVLEEKDNYCMCDDCRDAADVGDSAALVEGDKDA